MDHMQVPTSPLELRPLSPALSANSGSEFDEEEDAKKPKWYIQWLPLCILIVILLSPLPSTLYVLYTYHLLYLKSPLQFTLHLTTVSLLLFAAFSSLTVCVTRDPGPVIVDEESEQRGEGEGGGTADMGVREALMSPDFESRGGMERWCRKCWARKPERAHHCSHCGRCVLKMDHHCPWIGYKCIGHRTYPAFIHFLSSITLLALYVAFVSITALYHAFEHPFIVDETTVLNELFLACEGSACSLVVGSFLVYHFYLISTNQTTLEHLSPYLLLRSLPPLPPTAQGYRGHKLSEPPLEHELSYHQRSLVRSYHAHIRPYDIGWRANWGQALGWRGRGWVERVWRGGASPGDGRNFPRNPKTEEMLARLAVELVEVDVNR